MARPILIALGFLGLSFFVQNNTKDTISGDFNGDGLQEKAWIEVQDPGQRGNGEDIHYRPASHFLRVSDPAFPRFDIENSNAIYNLGDINDNGTDEIMVSGRHDENFDNHLYCVYTFSNTEKWWMNLVCANIPFWTYRNEPEKWVFQSNDTIYYWSSRTIVDSASPNGRIEDTLSWIVN